MATKKTHHRDLSKAVKLVYYTKNTATIEKGMIIIYETALGDLIVPPILFCKKGSMDDVVNLVKTLGFLTDTPFYQRFGMVTEAGTLDYLREDFAKNRNIPLIRHYRQSYIAADIENQSPQAFE